MPKAGHTGSLDPLATGMLPVCLGAATKVAQFGLTANKRYTVTARLGIATDTADADGNVIEDRGAVKLPPGKLTAALDQFRGDIQQIPPMYSALKHQGRRLYELARAGQEVPRNARAVHIHDLNLITADDCSFSVEVHCSKGTYVRTLVTDIAVAVGTVAHVTALRRDSVDPFNECRMWTLEELEERAADDALYTEEVLLPVDTVLQHWPAITLDVDQCRCAQHGQAVQITASTGTGSHRMYGPSGELLGIGELELGGKLLPKRIFI